MSGSSTSSQYISPYLWGPYNSYPSWYTDPYNYGSFYQAPTYPLYNPYVNGYANPYLNRYGRPYRNTSVYNVYLVNPYGVYGGYYP